MNSSKYYGLRSFLKPGCPISPSASFRDNIRLFLQECCKREAYKVGGMPIWCTFLFHEDRRFVLPLYTFEECVENSLQPLCDHCRCFGWSHHFVSKRNYHFIIPMDNEWYKRVHDGVLDLQTHILHGMIHCNGFGHVLCINGIEGGSNLIRGSDVMDLWDRICTTLHCRKISVVDTSKKRKMDLRLLCGVSHGQPWFGRWEYKFSHESIGVTKHEYEQALQLLSSLELNVIIRDTKNCFAKEMICRYRELSVTQLVTLRDIFRFMLELKFLTPNKRNNQHVQETDLVDSAITRYNVGSGSDVYQDVGYLYQLVLLDSDVNMVRFAVRTALDRKNFTKEWLFNGDADQFLRFICRVIPLEPGSYNRKESVGEQLLVPLGATIRDLKAAAMNAMQDMYVAMENLKVREIGELEGLDDEEVISGRLESGSEISVHGSGVNFLTTSNLNNEIGVSSLHGLAPYTLQRDQ